MISRRTGLLGGAAILLAAPSSTALYSMDLSSLSLGSFSWSPQGGAINTKLEERDVKDELRVGNNVVKVGISQQVEMISPEVKGIGRSVDFSKQENVNDKNSVSIIKTTYKEVEKENKTIQLDVESETKYQNGKQKASKYLKDYFSGRDKMDVYDMITGVGAHRKKRSAPKQITYSALNKKERTAFYEMYKLFEEMLNNKQNLLPRLYSIEGTLAPSKQSSTIPKAQSLQNHLSAIGWTSRDQVSYSTERKRGYGKPDTPNLWATSWNKNPYKPFLDQERDYTDLVAKVKKAEKSRDNFSFRRRLPALLAVLTGPDSVKAVFSGQGPVLNDLQLAKDAFPNRVALKFLDWMGQRRKRTRA